MAIACAVVGYGFAGRSFHSYLISLVPGMEVRGVVARDPEKRQRVAAELPSARVYSSVEEAVADEGVDLVVVATPHDTHAPVAVEALRAGKHVVVDKPIALSLAEAQGMYEAARRAGRELFVFHNRRWDSDFLTLRKLIDDGALGPRESVRWVEMAWNRWGTWKSWRASNARGGGRLRDLGAHLLDQLLLLNTSTVASVYARGHFDFEDSDTPSHCQVTLSFADGGTGVADVTSMTRYEKPRMLALGREGTFVKFGVDPQEDAMKRGAIDEAVTPPEQWGRLIRAGETRPVPPVPGRWRCFYEHVKEVLEGRAANVIREGEMLRLMAVMDAAHRSIASGTAERPEPTI